MKELTLTLAKEKIAKLEADCLLLARLAADTPAFFNPFEATRAKVLRDELLASVSKPCKLGDIEPGGYFSVTSRTYGEIAFRKALPGDPSHTRLHDATFYSFSDDEIVKPLSSDQAAQSVAVFMAKHLKPRQASPPPKPAKTCAYCGEPIKPGQPTVPDDTEPGERMHIGCAASDQDGQDIDCDLGDS